MNLGARAAAERPVSESLDQLILQSKALAAVDCGILITDHEARILWVNPAFCASTGYPAGELLGMTPQVLKSGKHDPSFYRQFWDTLLGGETWRGEFINRRRNGSLCVQAQTTTPMRRHGGGPITHFISVSQDITDGRKRKADWANIRSVEAFSQLVAGIAHHFNNLLTPIHANSQLLLELNNHFRPESRELVERTLAASRRAAHLIRQLACFSQRQVPDFQALDLNRVVEGVLREFLPAAKGRLECECIYCAGLPRVLADSAMLAQVIRQLLVNALEAMPQGGLLTLTTERLVMERSDTTGNPLAGREELVCLSVRDTGSGIAPDLRSRVFEPFFTTKDSGSHSGLGLALVHGIVKQHRGWIEIDGDSGRGATFKMFLPAITTPGALLELDPPARPRPVRARLSQAELAGSATLVEEPAGFSLDEIRSEPLLHWGINE